MLAGQIARRGRRRLESSPSARDDPDELREALERACAQPPTPCSSSPGRRPVETITRRASIRDGWARCRCTASRSSRGIPSCSGSVDATPVVGVPGYPVSAGADLRPRRCSRCWPQLLGVARHRSASASPGPGRAQDRLGHGRRGLDVRVRVGRVGGELVAVAARRRGRRPHLAGSRRRAATHRTRARRATTPATAVEVELLRPLARDRALDRLRRLARPRFSTWRRPRRCASVTRPRDVAQLERRSARSEASIALRDGLCHVAGTPPARRGRRAPTTSPTSSASSPREDTAVDPSRPSRAGPARRAGQSRSDSSSLDDLARDGVRYVKPPARCRHARAARTSSSPGGASDRETLSGYEREEYSHLAVAAAIEAGRSRLRPGDPRRGAVRSGSTSCRSRRSPFDLVLRAELAR